MRAVALVLGWTALVLGGVLFLLGIATWPPGGLMFALPFVFLIPGAALSLLGGLLLLVAKWAPGSKPTAPDQK